MPKRKLKLAANRERTTVTVLAHFMWVTLASNKWNALLASVGLSKYLHASNGW
ncbi:hypothetical protein AAOGI_44660 [Agarivorans albus]